MRNRVAGRLLLAAGVLTAAGIVFLSGCEKDLVPADNTPPENSQITSPEDGASLNSPVINVRGRAEVGAT